MNKVDLIPMVASETLTLWLLISIVRHAAFRRVPLFGIYVAYSSVAAALRMLSIGNYSTFFYVFWGTEAIYLVMAALCMYGSFYAVFRGMMLLPWFRLSYPLTCLLVIAYAAWKAVKRPPVEGYPLTSVIVGVEIGAQYLIAATFLLFGAAMTWLKVHGSRYHKGVVLGFGIAAFGMLIGTLVRSEFGTRFAVFSKFVPTVAYMLALVIWLSAFSTPLPDAQPISDGIITSESAERELKQYQLALRKTGRWKS
jgi:hypothetical protein